MQSLNTVGVNYTALFSIYSLPLFILFLISISLMHSFPLFILLLCLLSFHHVLSSYSLKNLVISLSLIFSLYLALPPSLRLSHTFLHAFAPSQSISLTLSALSFLLSPSVTHFHPNLYSWSLSCTPSSSFSFSLSHLSIYPSHVHPLSLSIFILTSLLSSFLSTVSLLHRLTLVPSILSFPLSL